MRNLLVTLVVLVGGFVLVAMYVAPTQPGLRAWYRDNACVHLDQVSPRICAPIRQAEGSDKV